MIQQNRKTFYGVEHSTIAWMGFLLISVLLRSLTPIFFKQAALQLEGFTAFNILTSGLYWISLLTLVLRAFTWQIVLRHLPLSIAYPFTSFSFIFLLIIAHFYFGEEILLSHIVGTIIIISGTLLLAAGRNGGANV